MTMNTKRILISLGCAVALAFARSACGQYVTYGSPYAPAYWGCGYQTTCHDSHVPYFALHPPVYYSYRVARTYGYSPFAYPPDVYLSNEGETSGLQQPGQPLPLRIDNPFVEQSGGSGVTKSRKPVGRQPQIVYPAAMARQNVGKSL
jgi:hypothetical protein